ncbi:hypothetical protein LIER_13502 [Lithospermum erythrorhizon]|uniref:Uncharacterized protein n=1 Tax=Lithospermum erythrorhizon TaxID=34254 RepID=A0AAV3PXV8_LITER
MSSATWMTRQTSRRCHLLTWDVTASLPRRLLTTKMTRVCDVNNDIISCQPLSCSVGIRLSAGRLARASELVWDVWATLWLLDLYLLGSLVGPWIGFVFRGPIAFLGLFNLLLGLNCLKLHFAQI